MLVCAGALLAPAVFAVGLSRLAGAGPGPRARRLVAGNLLVLGLALAVAFLAGEIYFRLLYDRPDAFGLTRASRRWLERHYVYNQAGPRDNVEYVNRILPGKRRVSFLGDSFTAGYGVADVGQRFANLIRGEMSDAWEIHLLAADGMDSGEQIEMVRDAVAAGYQLDVLVLVYVLNDIADIVPEWTRTLARVYRGQAREPFFVRHSFLVNTLYYRWKTSRIPELASYYGFVRDSYRSQPWVQQQQRLRGLAEFCRARGATFLVVTFPFLHALGPEYEFAEVHAALGDFWRGLSVPHLDLLGVYAGQDPGDLVVGRHDAHPNAHAHRMAAGAIRPFIEANIAIAAGTGDG